MNTSILKFNVPDFSCLVYCFTPAFVFAVFKVKQWWSHWLWTLIFSGSFNRCFHSWMYKNKKVPYRSMSNENVQQAPAMFIRLTSWLSGLKVEGSTSLAGGHFSGSTSRLRSARTPQPMAGDGVIWSSARVSNAPASRIFLFYVIIQLGILYLIFRYFSFIPVFAIGAMR